MNEEIDPGDWATFCERMTRAGRGQTVTLELFAPDGTPRETVEAVPLESVLFEKREGCNDAIWIHAQGWDQEILEPIRIWLTQNPEGGFNPVQIEAESGITRLHLRPALKPDVLEGLHGAAQRPLGR